MLGKTGMEHGVGGDWNVIRFPSEKSGGFRFTEHMKPFSDWIKFHSLVDLQLNGASFTRSDHK